MKTYETLAEWQAEGGRRFGGDDFEKWQFECPACGHVATVIDFKEFGGQPDDSYKNCIGRFNGKGVDGMTCSASKKPPPEHGCNWAAYGLFGTLSRGAVVKNGDKIIEVFDFAEPPSSSPADVR